jgi:hypothetical protein
MAPVAVQPKPAPRVRSTRIRHATNGASTPTTPKVTAQSAKVAAMMLADFGPSN